jgi:hypothetical protein
MGDVYQEHQCSSPNSASSYNCSEVDVVHLVGFEVLLSGPGLTIQSYSYLVHAAASHGEVGDAIGNSTGAFGEGEDIVDEKIIAFPIRYEVDPGPVIAETQEWRDLLNIDYNGIAGPIVDNEIEGVLS